MRELSFAVSGFLVASLVPAVLIAAFTPLSGKYDIENIQASFLFAWIWCLSFVLVLGVPAFLLLRRYRPGHWFLVMLVGGLLGVFVSILVRLPSGPPLSDFVSTVPLAAMSSLVFYAIWREGLPRSSPPATGTSQ